MTETSFSWNFDAGTLSDAVVQALEDSVQDRSEYGLPLAACLPGSDEPTASSKEHEPADKVPDEHDELLRYSPDKVDISSPL